MAPSTCYHVKSPRVTTRLQLPPMLFRRPVGEVLMATCPLRLPCTAIRATECRRNMLSVGCRSSSNSSRGCLHTCNSSIICSRSNSSREVSSNSSTARNESTCCELPQLRVGSLVSSAGSSIDPCSSNSNSLITATIWWTTVICTTERRFGYSTSCFRCHMLLATFVAPAAFGPLELFHLSHQSSH